MGLILKTPLLFHILQLLQNTTSHSPYYKLCLVMLKQRLTAPCKKLTGFKNAYRIRMGEYRIGFVFENGTIELIRILGRKDIYKYFP